MDASVYKDIGQQIRRARETLGLSQAELARRLGYNSAATVSHFESGERRVSIADLQRIAGELGLPLSYFLETAAPATPAFRIALRAQEVRPAGRTSVADFLAFIRVHGGAVQIAPMSSGTTPGKAAAEVLRRANYSHPPIAPREVAQSLGVPVFDWAFPDEISGIFAQEGEVAAIGVNEAHPYVRQRFTIAHELGHAVFRSRDLFVDFVEADVTAGHGDTQRQNAEITANHFAADLLMPRQWMRDDVTHYGLDVALLARRYQVSEQALWFRLLALKLVHEGDDTAGRL